MEVMPIFETPKGKVLFIHIPKTGGSTISRELARHHQMSMNTNSFWPGYDCTPQHLHAGPLTGLFEPAALAYVFTVVRNPVDRIRSEYNWNQKAVHQDAFLDLATGKTHAGADFALCG